ncbi:UNVERIFIED_CONTAM: hypothetical protein FKN15_033135 [Acipenser sinensis]
MSSASNTLAREFLTDVHQLCNAVAQRAEAREEEEEESHMVALGEYLVRGRGFLLLSTLGSIVDQGQSTAVGHPFGPAVDEMLQRSRESTKELVCLLPKRPPPVRKPAVNWRPRPQQPQRPAQPEVMFGTGPWRLLTRLQHQSRTHRTPLWFLRKVTTSVINLPTARLAPAVSGENQAGPGQGAPSNNIKLSYY